MTVLNVVLLGTPFVTEPRQALRDYLYNNYGLADPAKADVRFDLTFGSTGRNFVVVENNSRSNKPQILGNGRRKYTDTKRIQVLCKGMTNAQSNLFKIEEELDRIINTNIAGMNSYGINEVQLSEFVPLSTNPDGKKTLTKEYVYRSRALCTLTYEKVPA